MSKYKNIQVAERGIQIQWNSTDQKLDPIYRKSKNSNSMKSDRSKIKSEQSNSSETLLVYKGKR